MTATNIRELYRSVRTVSLTDAEDRSEAAYHACEPTIPAFVAPRNPHGTPSVAMLLAEIDRREALHVVEAEPGAPSCGPGPGRPRQARGPCRFCGAQVAEGGMYAAFCGGSCHSKWRRTTGRVLRRRQGT